MADEATLSRSPSSLDDDPVFAMHRGGKIDVNPSVDVPDRAALAMAYTPGVARVCSAIADEPELAGDYTWVGNTVAVVSDGTAVLGLGDIGPAAAMPVMEGKALLFKKFAGINAVPVCIDVTDVDDVVRVVAALAPSFGGINLEDISAPRCFEIEDRLRAMLDIPVMHDDQHGTAIVALAALRSAARVVGKELPAMRVVVCGAGASGIAVSKILLAAGVGEVGVSDSKGMIYHGRDGLNPVKAALAARTNASGHAGSVESALRGADVFIGLSGSVLPEEALTRMAPGAIAFLLSNPEPEVHPDVARAARGRGGDRPQRLPEPDQQLAGLPRRLPRRPGRPGDRDHREHEAGRRRRPRRPGGRRRDTGLRHPEPVRRAGGPGRRRRGRRPGPRGRCGPPLVGAPWRDGRPLFLVGCHHARVVIMFAVYAARIDAEDPLSGLETGERPDPEPPAGWATVTVKATALNHHDVWSLRGVGLAADRLPMILGCDAAGVDEDGNEVVVHGVIGDANAGGGDETLDPRRSLLSERYQGTFAERVAVPKANLVPKPAALSFEEAACLPTAYLTAYKMLFDKSGAQPGSTILVQGAGGGVATALILLGRAAGYRMWVTSRTEAKRDAAVKLGADQAFPTGARLPERVDVVMETVGQATWSHSVRSLKPGGRIVISGATSGDVPPAELTRIFFTQLSVVGSTMGTRDQLGRLRPLLRADRHPPADRPGDPARRGP